MKRSFKAAPGQPIKAVKGPYGNEVSVDLLKMQDLRGYLQLAFDTLEEMDDETFQAVDGEGFIDDLDIAIHEVNDAIRFAENGTL